MSVVIGLPKTMLSSPEASLSEGCSAQWVRIQPSNVSSVVSQNASLAASSVLNSMPFPSQDVRFSIPVGQGKNVWLDNQRTTVAFKCKYEVVTASIGAATITGSVVSNGFAWFDRLQSINSNGVNVEDVNNLAISEHHNQIYSFNSSERDSLALPYGYKFDDEATDSRNTVTGHDITAFSATASTLNIGSSTYSYCVPLPSSLLGYRAKSMLPVGALAKLDVYLTTTSTCPVIITSGAGITTSAVVKMTLSDFAINAYYITLDDKSASLLGSPKMHFVHGITSRVSSATVNSGVQGQVSALIGVRAQSVRALATRFSESALTTAGSLGGVFDSKMPLCSQMNLFLNGKDKVPSNYHNTITAPATVFAHAMQASEAFTEKKMKFGGVPLAFCTYLATSSAPTSADGYDQNTVNAGSDTYQNSLQSFCFAEDLRKASTSTIMDGYNLAQSSSNYLELNIAKAPTNTIYVTFIASCDCIYLIDLEQGTIDFRL